MHEKREERTHLILPCERRLLLVMIAEDDGPRNATLVQPRRPLENDRLRVPRRLLPVQLIAAENDQVRLDLLERRLKPFEAVDIRTELLALGFALPVEVAALTGADGEVQVGDLEDAEVAGIRKSEDGRRRRRCEQSMS